MQWPLNLISAVTSLSLINAMASLDLNKAMAILNLQSNGNARKSWIWTENNVGAISLWGYNYYTSSYEGHKNYFKDWCLMNSQSAFLFFNLFKLSELWPYYQEHVNQIILYRTTFWSLALQIFEAFVWILMIVNLSLNQTLLTFLHCVRQT